MADYTKAQDTVDGIVEAIGMMIGPALNVKYLRTDGSVRLTGQ